MEPLPGGGTRVVLTHDYGRSMTTRRRRVDRQGVDRNSESELAGV